jgi:hypothetical protein
MTQRINSSNDAKVYSDGFITTMQPAANAGASFRVVSPSGGQQWGYAVIRDRPAEELDLSEVDLDSYPFTWVNGNKAVFEVNDGPPMSAEGRPERLDEIAHTWPDRGMSFSGPERSLDCL